MKYPRSPQTWLLPTPHIVNIVNWLNSWSMTLISSPKSHGQSLKATKMVIFCCLCLFSISKKTKGWNYPSSWGSTVAAAIPNEFSGATRGWGRMFNWRNLAGKLSKFTNVQRNIYMYYIQSNDRWCVYIYTHILLICIYMYMYRRTFVNILVQMCVMMTIYIYGDIYIYIYRYR